MSKIGFFGGCFNPPTLAHFEIVKNALNNYNLDKVVIVPMGDKYQKKDLISFEHRFQMLCKMFENEKNVEISNMQANQEKRSYIIDSFKEIEEKYPNDDKYFIMGEDNFYKIENLKSIIKNRKFIVFERKDNTSSSLVRKRIKTNEDIKHLTFPVITNYIKKQGLYK